MLSVTSIFGCHDLTLTYTYTVGRHMIIADTALIDDNVRTECEQKSYFKQALSLDVHGNGTKINFANR